jgi:signal peptidase I
MSDDVTRGGSRAGSSAAGGESPDPWLRHELEDPASAGAERAADRPADDPWLRHDLAAERHADDQAGREPGTGDPRPAEDPGYDAAPSHRHDTDPGRVGHTQPLPAVDDWAVYAAAAPAPADDEPHERRTRSTGRRHGVGAMLGAAGRELVIVVGMALVLSFVVKTWLLQAFYIPSGSMEDTLVLNDRVIVSKLTPGPFDLKRGDIVVFSDPGDWLDAVPQEEHGPAVTAIRNGLMFVGLLPDDSENHLIKRVIGLPGDHVVCCDEGERLTVNGAPLVEPYLKPGDAPSNQEFDIRVPEGSVWVMGDHRSDSSDSRFHDPSGTGADGSVPQSLVVGRAVALVWPLDHLAWLSNPRATFAKVPNPPTGG